MVHGRGEGGEWYVGGVRVVSGTWRDEGGEWYVRSSTGEWYGNSL